MELQRNLKLTIAYDGHDFAGWQIQPDRPTIQGTLVSVIEHITGEKTLPQGSGRTDAGVHARAQVATVSTQSPIPLANFRKALNDLLPATIRVLSVEEAPPEFHARKSAHTKTYEYRIYRSEICPPFLCRYVYHHPYPLNESRMTEAAAVVLGEHDFTSFAAVDPERKKPEPKKSEFKQDDAGAINVRTIYSSTWHRSGDELIYRVRGNGFLHHMVRNLVGTYLMVGKGNVSLLDLQRILEARDRSAASATAPASGLFLLSVEY